MDQAKIITKIGTCKVEPTQRGRECHTTGLPVTVQFILEGHRAGGTASVPGCLVMKGDLADFAHSREELGLPLVNESKTGRCSGALF